MTTTANRKVETAIVAVVVGVGSKILNNIAAKVVSKALSAMMNRKRWPATFRSTPGHYLSEPLITLPGGLCESASTFCPRPQTRALPEWFEATA